MLSESATTRVPVEMSSPPRELVVMPKSATADKADGEAIPVTSFLYNSEETRVCRDCPYYWVKWQ